MDCSLVYITASTMAEAEKISEALVTGRMVACTNILGAIDSIYTWQGQKEKGREVALIAKTRSALVPYVIEKVKNLHSYDCPCIVSVPIGQGNPDFLQWIHDQTGE